MSSNSCNYIDYEGGDKETAGWDCACGCLAVRLARVCGPVLQPIGCTFASAVPAPLKSRYVTWGAIQVLYAALCLNIWRSGPPGRRTNEPSW